ncbi:MAG: tetratricopeptide repeat protein [Akkermansiaceae bacterium]|nr:tetratricopeptide repeat protein [Akkermansiaceae bacterium]
MSYSVISYQLLLISVLLTSLLSAAEPLPLSRDYWKDEAFLKSFNGSYRVNAQIEPVVTTAERGLLVSIQPLMAAGKRKEALEKLIGSPLVKTSAAIAYNAGNIQFELGELKEAAGHYQSALAIFPSFRRAHRNLGFVYARQDDWDKALKSLEEAIRLGDQDGATYGQLAYGRMHKEQYASALQAYRLAQLTQPESVDWKAGTAQCLQHLQRNEEALALLDEVITARPTETSYYLLQSSIYLSMDRSDDAITNLDLVRRMGEGKLDADNHLLLANLHLRAGSNQLARPVMMAALEMENKAPAAAALNALEFATQVRDWKLARDFSLALEKAYPEIKDAKLQQKQQRLTALIDIDSGEDPARGAKVLESLIKENPLDGESLLLLGRYRMTEKRYQEAEMLFQQAGRVEGHEYTSRIELAKAYVATSRYRDAVSQLDKALKIRPVEAIQTYRDAVYKLADAAE